MRVPQATAFRYATGRPVRVQSARSRSSQNECLSTFPLLLVSMRPQHLDHRRRQREHSLPGFRLDVFQSTVPAELLGQVQPPSLQVKR